MLGYRDPRTYAILLGFVATTGISAYRLSTAEGGPFSDRAIRFGTAAFALIVTCGLALGALRQVTVLGYLVAQTLLLIAVSRLDRSDRTSASRKNDGEEALKPGPAIAAISIVGALLVFGLAYGITHAPLTLYDSVSYHLFFPARWLQDRALSILPTPFSDEAQAYAPVNGELYFLWLMMPFHGDLLARIGQFPFALLGAATLYALARRLDAPPEHAIYPAAFFVLARQVTEQAVGANVDLICATMFLIALYLGIEAIERNRARDWIWWGVAVGLFCGTKYVAIVYAPVLLLVALSRGFRVRLLWASPGIALFALPWYLRNWVVAGSPLYPATLKVAGFTIAQGAFTRDAMLNTIFHTNDLRLFPTIVAHGYGAPLAIVWPPLAVFGVVAMVRRAWWPHGVLALTPLVMAPLFWFGFPVNIDSRFLMPALAAGLLPFAFVFRGRRAFDSAAHALLLAAMLWILVGAPTRIPARLPWFMGGWLDLDGLVAPSFVLAFLALATVLAVLLWQMAQSRRSVLATGFSFSVIAAAVLAIGAQTWCRPFVCDYLKTESPFIRPNLQVAWDWLAGNVTHATIAYTGINLPYPLTGERLTNRVMYVNIDGHPRWRFHDYDRAIRSGRLETPSSPLATSSGELKPVAARSGPRDDAVRPRYERMSGSKEAWIGNLAVLGVTHVFVAALSAYEIDQVWHNAGGFPIEDDWAASEPRFFRLVYENPQVHVYAVTLLSRNRA